MKIFEVMTEHKYEQLVFFCDAETGLKGITCIHNTVLGPALGGTRL
jgi:leucine dehydrogenase